MVRQEVLVGQVFGWHLNLSSNKAAKVTVVIVLCLVLPQGGGEHDTIVIGRKGYQPLVKGFVVECRQADTIARIETVTFVQLVRPWDDMAGQQQLRYVNSR